VSRRGYDVTDASRAPVDGDVYLGYVDGSWRSYDALRARFPGKRVVGIAVLSGTNAGTVFDGPPDNGTWDHVVDWVVMRRHAGVDPSVYTDSDQWPTAQATFSRRGVAPPHWWIANWNGVDGPIAGAVAHQYASNNDYDSSWVADYWPGVDPAPAPAPAPQPTPAPAPPPPPPPPPREQDMMMVVVTGDPLGIGDKAGTVLLIAGDKWGHVTDSQSESAFSGAGVPIGNITPAQYQVLVTMLGEPAK
jgi:hypothetical protein